jgi:NADH dehydrogenase (ubiquinone) flavoprotein 1
MKKFVKNLLFNKFNKNIKQFSSTIILKEKTTFGDLKDTDRIFTNLYGENDYLMNGALKRGDWHRTKDLIVKGHDWVINEIKASGKQKYFTKKD